MPTGWAVMDGASAREAASSWKRSSKDERIERKLKRFAAEIEQADAVYEKWEKKFRCKRLQKYYEGHQRELMDDPEYRKYTVNLFFAAIEARRPSLVFNRPKAHVVARPNRADDVASNVDARAKLLEDTGNTFVQDPEVGAMEAWSLAVHDAFFRFGVVEVGYSADLVDNPRADRPVLDDEGEEVYADGEPVVEPQQLIQRESVFYRWIPAEQFRMSASGKNETMRNDWCGYFEWVRPEDIRDNPQYDGRAVAEVRAKGRLRRDIDKRSSFGVSREDRNSDLVKIWHRWDLREKKLFVFIEEGTRFLKVEPFEQLPFALLRFHPQLGEWYPVPPTYNWLSPQDEYNDARDSQRLHRQRAKRRYLYVEGRIDEDELLKLESDEDMVYARVNGGSLDNVLAPVQDAPLDRSMAQSNLATKDDFTLVSSIGGEQRAVAESKTATQANLINVEAQIREEYSKSQVRAFVADSVTIMLKTIIDLMVLDVWIKTNVDLTSEGAMIEAQHIAETWQQFSAADLDYDFHWEVQIDVESMASPVTDEKLRGEWTNILSTVTNPSVAPLLMASPAILRKTMKLYGITDEKDIAEIRNAMALLAGIQQAGGAGGPGPEAEPGGGGGAPAGAPETGGAMPPSMAAILSQITQPR